MVLYVPKKFQRYKEKCVVSKGAKIRINPYHSFLFIRGTEVLVKLAKIYRGF
jgi:hypothetical protein